jgi:hypothetical protein
MTRNDWKAMVFNLQREVTTLRRERVLLAKLASTTPQFFNPLAVAEAEAIRDRVLAASNALAGEVRLP